MRLSTLFAVFTSALLLTGPATAQDAWELDVRAGASNPTEDLGPDALDTGFGFEATIGYRFLPHLSAYGGWDWRHFEFEPEVSFAGTDAGVEETGYAFGLRFEHPFSRERSDGIAFRVRAGATLNHIEIEDDDGEEVADSGHGLGWEGGAGITFPLTDALRLSPVVRYRSLSRDIDIDDVTTEVDLRYIAAELGVTWRF
jgi:opacity protein-like surface antigen